MANIFETPLNTDLQLLGKKKKKKEGLRDKLTSQPMMSKIEPEQVDSVMAKSKLIDDLKAPKEKEEILKGYLE